MAVAFILQSGDHAGKLYSSTDIALALNAASDADNNPEIDISIDFKLVIRAFVFDGKLEYTLPYCSYFGYDGDDRVLFYRHFRRNGRNCPCIAGLGCFSSADRARSASIVRWNFGLGEPMKCSLVDCFINETKKRAARQKHVTRPSTSLTDNSRQVSVSPPPDDQPASDDQPAKLYYIIDGLASEIDLDASSLVSLSDLRANIPQDRPIEGEAKYRSVRLNGVDMLVQNRVEVVMTHYLSRLKNKAEKIDRLTQLFKKDVDFVASINAHDCWI